MRKLSVWLTVATLVLAACISADTTTPPTAAITPTPTTTTSGGEREPAAEVDATVTLGAEGCTSTIPNTWAEREMIVELVRNADALMHFGVGTYNERSSREDLLALGTDLSSAHPPFGVVDYHEHVIRRGSRIVRLDFEEPGRYWMVCFDDADIDVVFPDVIVGS